MANQVAKFKLTNQLAKKHLTALEKNHLALTPSAWDALFPVKSFGQSIRGRILRNAIELEMKGPDLRLYKPD